MQRRTFLLSTASTLGLTLGAGCGAFEPELTITGTWTLHEANGYTYDDGTYVYSGWYGDCEVSYTMYTGMVFDLGSDSVYGGSFLSTMHTRFSCAPEKDRDDRQEYAVEAVRNGERSYTITGIDRFELRCQHLGHALDCEADSGTRLAEMVFQR